MSYVRVTEYGVEFKPENNDYRIGVRIADSSHTHEPKINSESEFVAVLMMLGKEGVEIDTHTGRLRLPRRLAGT